MSQEFVECKGLHEFAQGLGVIEASFKTIRRQVMREASAEMKDYLDNAVSNSWINDPHGKVLSWQETKVGSKGGYAAVRPKKGGYGKTMTYASVTAAVEHGHPVRKPGMGKRYRPRRKQNSVDGVFFYDWTISFLPKIAERLAANFKEKLLRRASLTK